MVDGITPARNLTSSGDGMDDQVSTGTEQPVDEGVDLVTVSTWVGLPVAVLLIGVVIWLTVGRSNALPQIQVSGELADDGMPEPVPEGPSVFGRFAAALSRSREALQGQFDALFGAAKVDEELFDDLEATLLSADVGAPTTMKILDVLRDRYAAGVTEPEELREVLRGEVDSRLRKVHKSLTRPEGVSPWVILVVGVNGSGKTTTIGKLAARFTSMGLRVMLAAGDTYRAAAADQLAVWAERANSDIVRGDEGSDPGAVVYQALESAQAKGHDVVLVDTAGRLQTARPLMEQLTKIRRVIGKRVPEGPHETLLVLDGTMGQNAMSQARLFNEATPLSAVAITKLDGTAKGGMILALGEEYELPVALVGIGEGVDDLRDFDVESFVQLLA